MQNKWSGNLERFGNLKEDSRLREQSRASLLRHCLVKLASSAFLFSPLLFPQTTIVHSPSPIHFLLSFPFLHHPYLYSPRSLYLFSITCLFSITTLYSMTILYSITTHSLSSFYPSLRFPRESLPYPRHYDSVKMAPPYRVEYQHLDITASRMAEILRENGFKHVFCGGFAAGLIGAQRVTTVLRSDRLTRRQIHTTIRPGSRCGHRKETPSSL